MNELSFIVYTLYMYVQASLRRTEQELRQANREITVLRRRSVVGAVLLSEQCCYVHVHVCGCDQANSGTLAIAT